MRKIIVNELHNKLKTKIEIGHLAFRPISMLNLENVAVFDQQNQPILEAKQIFANIEFLQLFNGKIVINSAQLDNFDCHLSKANSNTPLNIQFILNALKGKKKKNKSKIRIKINAIDLENGNLKFDKLDQPYVNKRFDKNHVSISHLKGKFGFETFGSDSIAFKVKYLSLKEKSGFDINSMRFRCFFTSKHFHVREFFLKLPHSYIDIDLLNIILPTSGKPNLQNTKARLSILPSEFQLNDFAAFIPQFKELRTNGTLEVSNIDNEFGRLSLKNLKVKFGTFSLLKIPFATLDQPNLLKKGKTYTNCYIDKLQLDATDIRNVLKAVSKSQKPMPLLTNLKTASYTGYIKGFSSDLNLNGELSTNLGQLDTNIHCGFNPQEEQSFGANGDIYLLDVDLQKLLNNNQLNKLSSTINFKFKSEKGKKSGSVNTSISRFDFKGYTFHRINVDGKYKNNEADVTMKLDDPNAKLSVTGQFNNKSKDKELLVDIKAKHISFDKLHLYNKWKNTSVSFNVDANLKGQSIDGLGYINIDSLHITKDDQTYKLKKLSLSAVKIANEKMILLTSDLMNGKIIGDYSLMTLADNIKQTGSQYLNSLITKPKSEKMKENNFLFKLNIHKTQSLCKILNLPAWIDDSLCINGYYNKIENNFSMDLASPSISLSNGTSIKSTHIHLTNRKDGGLISQPDSLYSNVYLVTINKKQNKDTIQINSVLANNKAFTDFDIKNEKLQKFSTHFSSITTLSKGLDKKLKTEFEILPGELTLNHSKWDIHSTQIKIQDKNIYVNNFNIDNQDKTQSLKIDGEYANNSRIPLRIDLKRLDMHYIFETLNIEVLKFGGIATGNLEISELQHQPYIKADLGIKNFSFNSSPLGDMNISSHLDTKEKKFVMDGVIVNKENHQTKVHGYIAPLQKAISINFDADKLNIGFLSGFSKAIFNKVSGLGSGHVHLFGDFSNVTVEGKAFIENGNLGIKMLNTNYSFSDSVYLKKDLIYFKNIKLIDDYQNQSIASGQVSHHFFHNFNYKVDLKTDNFLVYNVSEKQNPVFSGKVFGKGNAIIDGNEKRVDITVNMKTEKNTKVKMNFMGDEVNNYNFITFKKLKTDTIASSKPKLARMQSSGMDVRMNFFIDATDDATAEIVMDPVGGDMIKGTGNGTLQFSWSTKSAPKIMGTYDIDRGNYKFTFEKLLEKHFIIQHGSSVEFNGNPFDALVNINAIYKVTANLVDLNKELAKLAGQTNIPVNCILNLTGALRHPNINLGIDFPAADPEVERELKSLLNTQEMINRQIAYLLILSKFYPNYEESDQHTSDFASVASATLSSQLTKIVSQIDHRWQLGANVRYGDSEKNSLTDTDVELLLSSQLLNDRLLINGNFGYRTDALMQRDAIIGDVDFELLLNKSGNWRVKAYNHYNEKYYYTSTAAQTQGLSIMYKRDFDRLKDLFVAPKLNFWKKKKKKKDINEDKPKELTDDKFIRYVNHKK